MGWGVETYDISDYGSIYYYKVLFPNQQYTIVFAQDLLPALPAKIPPRVNDTAHWMSCTGMYKRYGYLRSLLIFLSQAIFGTVDEVSISSCT